MWVSWWYAHVGGYGTGDLTSSVFAQNIMNLVLVPVPNGSGPAAYHQIEVADRRLFMAGGKTPLRLIFSACATILAEIAPPV